MVSVIIPCYRVKNRISGVLSEIPSRVDKIYVVDDACPEGTGEYIRQTCKDPRVTVLVHPANLGVGGAVKTGYRKALEDGATILVKLDGDGQMDPRLIPGLIDPVLSQSADYVKGNRFYDIAYLRKMPVIRRFGNAMVSFINKMASGYWNIMDPSNGFTAIGAGVLRFLPLDKIDNRFFFESDMLFRLNTIRAVVQDFPMKAEYGNEVSNLKVWKVLFGFPFKFCNRTFKRIFYNYFLRDFNIGSLELVVAFVFLVFGFVFGAVKWTASVESSQPATAGTVLLAGLPIILGFQALISFLHFDVGNIPQKPVSSMNI
jgi:glycosyltransferase involved in cell wall biosynthesis